MIVEIERIKYSTVIICFYNFLVFLFGDVKTTIKELYINKTNSAVTSQPFNQ